MRYQAPAAKRTADRLARIDYRGLPSRRAAVAPIGPHRLRALTEQDLAGPPQSRAHRAAVHRDLTAGVLDEGRWDLTEEGRPLWRWSLSSTGAAGLRMHFQDFDAGAGRVWIHDGSGEESEIHGPYSAKGPNGNGEFWSDAVLSETAIVEFEPAAGGSPTLPFRIDRISHLLDGALPVAKAGASQAAASCHLDVSCYPEWSSTARAVVHILYEEDGNGFVCSGTLLNTRNSSGTPYFLTADHCVNTDTVARTVQAFFFYQTSECNGRPVTRRDAVRTLGARYLTGGGVARGDFSLLRLDSIADGALLSGWTADEIPIGADVFGIHHPSGDYKRFSFGRRIRTGSQLPGANPDRYYTASFDGGIIEGGSSGSGLFSAPGVLVGSLSSGPKEDGEAACRIKPFPGNYGKFSDMYESLRTFLDPTGAGAPTGTLLNSGEPANFTVGPVTGPTLFGRESSYRVNVPQGATSLNIRIATGGAGAAVEFWVRRDRPPELVDGRIVADYQSPGRSGNETLTINSASNPALRAGTYYVALALYTVNSTVRGVITASVTSAPGAGGNVLANGQPRQFRLGPVSAGTLYRGENGFVVDVPEGARTLEVTLTTDNLEFDADLYLRYGEEPFVENSLVVADHRSITPNGREQIVVTLGSQPPLRPGRYYVGIGIFARNVVVTGNVVARITGGGTTAPPPTGTVDLSSGVTRTFRLEPVPSPVLVRPGFRIRVPEGATRLEVRLQSPVPGVDLDLYARQGTPPEATGGRVISDFRSIGAAADETIVITRDSSPRLTPGDYFLSVAVFTPNTAIDASIVATVSSGQPSPPPDPGGPARLASGVAAPVVLPSVANATLFIESLGYFIDVPENTARLEIRLRTQTDGADLDLFARWGESPRVVDGGIAADFRSIGPDGNEVIIVSDGTDPALRSGRYYINLAAFTPNLEARATLTATVVPLDSGQPAPGETRELTPDVPAKFALPAVTTPTLFRGEWSYYLTVPAGITRMEVRLRSNVPSIDVDVYARYDADVDLAEDGAIVADWASRGETGNENLTITAEPGQTLREGTYYFALVLFSRGAPAEGTISATLSRVSAQSGGGDAVRKDLDPATAQPLPSKPVNQTGDVAPAKAVVNVDDGDVARATVEHPQ